MTNFEQRLKALESKAFMPSSDICISIIIGKGEQPSAEQQAQMDEVELLGGLVIIHQVV